MLINEDNVELNNIESDSVENVDAEDLDAATKRLIKRWREISISS